MSISTPNRHGRIAIILIALCAFSASANDNTRPDDYVARARQFLRALYPDLSGELRPVIIGHRLRDRGYKVPDSMNLFTMLLYDFDLGLGGEPMITDWSSPAVTAVFGFDWQTEKKELHHLTVKGPAIEGPVEKFAAEAAKHDDWSEAMVSAALKEAGARFGPDQKAEFLAAFPREELKPFMGGDLNVVSAAFRFDRSSRLRIPPYWVVLAKWHALDGRESDCTLAFEPIHGYITMIWLMPVDPKPEVKPRGQAHPGVHR